MTRKSFGELETEILQILWKRKTASVAEVQHALKGSPYAYTTVMTVLSRLHAKGVLEREKEHRGYRYRLKPSANPAPRGIMERLKKQVFTDSSVETFSYLLAGLEELSPADMAAIEKILGKYRKKSDEP